MDKRQTLIAYLLSKVEAEDWHGVADAAMDLREVDAEARGLQKGSVLSGDAMHRLAILNRPEHQHAFTYDRATDSQVCACGAMTMTR